MTITELLRHLYFDDYEYTRLVDLTSQPRLHYKNYRDWSYPKSKKIKKKV